VRMFERKGVIFEADLDKIPPWSLVVISAHGVGPLYRQKLRSRWIRWIDATCPLVEKVHREAINFINSGYHIIYIGKRWHQEALWVLEEWTDRFSLVENLSDLDWLEIQGPVALLTQTTLSVDDTKILIESARARFPDIVLPKTSDICYATTNRQNALRALALETECIFIVGSKNSSNSTKLLKLAWNLGKRAYLIDWADEIKEEWLLNVSRIGVTSWASWPEELVSGVIDSLVSIGGIFEREIRITEEKIEFPYTLTVFQ
jgi:4-hydroxy-3-methylbut-2-enyl diphosphate reductase